MDFFLRNINMLQQYFAIACDRRAEQQNNNFSSKLKPVLAATLLAVSQHSMAANNNVETKLELGDVPVTGNPLGVSSDQLVIPVSVLGGRELSLRRESTIGETLNGMPGVTATQFGPNVSRPMIRGLDADRVRIMQNGVGVLDASSLSGDHAVSIDPLIIEQIDVVRGPAALLYGGNAMGGAVNAIDHRIPTEALNGVFGRGETRFGGPADLRSGAAVVDFGNDKIGVHIDAFTRHTNDLNIPGYAVSDRLFAQEAHDDHDDEEEHGDEHEESPRKRGRLTNSSAKQNGGAIGASLTFDHGYIGTSYSLLENNYGVVAEDAVRIDLESKRWDIASEFFDLGGWIQRTKVKLAHTDYQHVELEDGEVGTTFSNQGWQGTFEAGHSPIGQFNGVIGYQFSDTEFSALGDEAFVPTTETKSHALYVYEELPIDVHKVTFGARFGHDQVNSKTNENFGAGQDRSFNPNSFALGGVLKLSDQWDFATNLSHNERAPSYFELYANGVHLATNQFEVGDTNLSTERSNGIDAQFRWKLGEHKFNISTYYTRFNNFIGLFDTGEEYEGEVHSHGDDDEHEETHIPITQFRAVPARFVGIEFDGKYQATSSLAVNFRGDYVNAKETDNNTYLPRIAPARLGLGLNYEKGPLNMRFDALHAFDQRKTAENELATDGYTNVTALLAYKLPSKYHVELFAKANNLLNDEIRDHASFLKDIAPAGERSLVVGARADF
jgi:iron complex outermembrane receptor protein